MTDHLAAAGCRGGGKVEILFLDFHFSTAHIQYSLFLFCFWFFSLSTIDFVGMW